MIKHSTLGNIDLYDKEIKKLICCFLAGYSLYLMRAKLYNWKIKDIIDTARELDLIKLHHDPIWANRASHWLLNMNNKDIRVCG